MRKARCPHCQHETEEVPMSRLCTECLTFSADWYVYDWQAYRQLARWAIRANAVLLALCAFNGVIILRSGAENVIQAAICLLAIPAIIGIVVNFRRIHCPEKYHGHRFRDIFTWRTRRQEGKRS